MATDTVTKIDPSIRTQAHMLGANQEYKALLQYSNLSESGPVYRVTEAEWHEIRQTHFWVVATYLVATVSIVISFIGIVVTLSR